MTPSTAKDLLTRLRQEAPWLLDPELAVCAVGSTALAHACERRGIPGPRVADLDMAWSLDVEAGRKKLEAEGDGFSNFGEPFPRFLEPSLGFVIYY